MKVWKTLIIPLIATILLLGACSASPQKTTNPFQQIQVVKGDLTSSVNGSGKVALASDASLAFGSAGKLAVLNVKEGDSVTKGQTLAKLDTSALELALSQSKVALDQANLGLLQAQAALQLAQFNLDRTKSVSDILDEIDSANLDLRIAQMQADEAKIYSDSNASIYWAGRIGRLQLDLLEKQKKLADLLSQDEFAGQYLYLAGQKYDRLLVEDARLKKLQVDSAQKTVDQFQHTIEQAQKNLDYVQKQLNDAVITAPFDGIAAKVNYKQGDYIPAPTVSPQIIIYLVDSRNLEVDINIDEMDISRVAPGQKALINLDAVLGNILEGTVNSISTVPAASPSAVGSATYLVKVNFSNSASQTLKAGMNAGVDIITGERHGVLLLPDNAIKQDTQGQSYVEVLSNNKIVSKPVNLGLVNKDHSEIISGLTEGETVLISSPPGKWSAQ
jgi:HlyD family secretion protein